jgi:hypothetical protein
MTWNGIIRNDFDVVMAAIETIRRARSREAPDWLPESAGFYSSPPLNERKHRKLLNGLLLWIRTAHGAGYGPGSEVPELWLPTESDVMKSALFERIRSGKAPLPEPPPISLACPWYALVEDPGPHFLGDELRVEPVEGKGELARVGFISFGVVERRREKECIVRDFYHVTSYRFRLWLAPDWRHPTTSERGGWFIQNLVFSSADR